jgi:hypothetical protein
MSSFVVVLVILVIFFDGLSSLQHGVPRVAEIKKISFCYFPSRLKDNKLLPLSMSILKKQAKEVPLWKVGSLLPAEWEGEVEIR